jgi:hypothetical protein
MLNRYPRLAERATVSASEGDGVDNEALQEASEGYYEVRSALR